MKPGRWLEITPSDYPWEREALDFLRERLPDTEPFRAWSNFEFVARISSLLPPKKIESDWLDNSRDVGQEVNHSRSHRQTKGFRTVTPPSF